MLNVTLITTLEHTREHTRIILKPLGTPHTHTHTHTGTMAALTLQNKKISELGEQRFLIAGAGSAGLGVARKLAEAIVHQGKYSFEQALEKFWVCDVNGVLASDNKDLTEEQRVFARDDDTAGLDLKQVADKVKPTALLGLTACGGLFKRDLVESVSSNCERPIIFPLSNPTSSAECTSSSSSSLSLSLFQLRHQNIHRIAHSYVTRTQVLRSRHMSGVVEGQFSQAEVLLILSLTVTGNIFRVNVTTCSCFRV